MTSGDAPETILVQEYAMRFTVTKKIITGLAIILVIGALSMLIVYDGLNKVKTAMIELAEVKEPIVAAGNEMEINMNGIGMSVLRYLNTPDPRYRRRVARDEQDFKRFLDQYFQLAGTQELRELGITVDALYTDFRILGRELMDKKDRQETVFAEVAAKFEHMDAILDRRLQPFIDPADREGFRKAIRAADLEADIAEIGNWLANYQRSRQDEYKRLLFENEREFRHSLAQFKELYLTDTERYWTDQLEALLDQTMALIRDVIGLEDYLQALGNRFSALRTELDDVLDHDLGPLVRRDLYAPRQMADQATAQVISVIRVLIPVFLLSVVGTALLLIRVITKPVRRLMQGTDAISHGDLHYRLVPTGRDEFTDLSHQFNQMVAQLQITTVSKDLLEASEAKLQETVANLSREIAERVRAQEEQARLQGSLRRSETMAAMGVLVAGVAHEVRNPIFGISSTLDAFEARFGTEEASQRYIHVLRGELHRLTELTRELLEYGRPLSSELVPAQVEEAIAEAVQASTPLAKRGNVEIISHVSWTFPPVLMDRRRLLQAFQNLLDNAVQHSPPGGIVTVEAEVVRDAEQAWITCAIKDSGPGFQTEDVPRIFEPFFSRRRGGTGLGLSIVQRIVEEHHGTIAACNQRGGGAVMTVRLPLAES
jgi:signal transduction histidine kinase